MTTIIRPKSSTPSKPSGTVTKVPNSKYTYRTYTPQEIKQLQSIARGTYSGSGGGSSQTQKSTDQQTTSKSSKGSTTSKVEVKAAPKTPTTTTQKVLQSFKAPSSQFRTATGAALLTKTYTTKSGEVVKYDYGTLQEQVAARRQAREAAKQEGYAQLREAERNVWISDLTKQQKVSKALRSSAPFSAQYRAELQSQLRKPTSPVPKEKGVMTTSLYGKPQLNLGYKIESAAYKPREPGSVERIFPSLYYTEAEAYTDPGKYLAKRTLIGGVYGVGTGLVMYGAGAAGAAGGAALGVGALGVGSAYTMYKTTKDLVGDIRAVSTGGWKAYKERSEKQLREKQEFYKKYAGEIAEGIGGGLSAGMTYYSAAKYYAGTPMLTKIKTSDVKMKTKGTEVSTKQTSTSEFKIAGKNYKITAYSKSKGIMKPGLQSNMKTNIKYDVFKQTSKGFKPYKTGTGLVETTISPKGKFISKETTKLGFSTSEQVTKGTLTTAGKQTVITSKTGIETFGKFKPTTEYLGLSREIKEITPKVNPFTPAKKIIGLPTKESIVSVKGIVKPYNQPKKTIKFPFIGKKGSGAISVPRSTTIYPTTPSGVKPTYLSIPKTKVSPVITNLESGLVSVANLVSPLSRTALGVGLAGAFTIPRVTTKYLARSYSPINVRTAGISSTKVSYATLTQPVVSSKALTSAPSITQPITVSEPYLKIATLTQPLPLSTSIPYSTSPSLVPEFPLPVPVGLPSFPSLQLLEGRGKPSVLKRQKKRYTPSLAAITFKIRGKKPKIITGLGVRPLLNKRKKRF